MVGKALNHYWVLKAIELFQSSAVIDSNEYLPKNIDSLLVDPKIKKILTEPPILSMS